MSLWANENTLYGVYGSMKTIIPLYVLSGVTIASLPWSRNMDKVHYIIEVLLSSPGGAPPTQFLSPGSPGALLLTSNPLLCSVA